MTPLKQRIENLENRPQLQPEDEEFLRYKLAAEALRQEDFNLFNRYLDAIETAPRLTLEAAMEHATGEELAACKRLRELEALPLEELRRLVA